MTNTSPADMTKIEHLVILMMENRSFDHYLGALSLSPENRIDIDGLSDQLKPLLDKDHRERHPTSLDGMYCGYGDPPHGRKSQNINYNQGKMDGFVTEYQRDFPDAPEIPMSYYTRDTLPVLYALSDYFTVCDRWFSSMLSSTWPNRKYLHSGRRDEDDDTQTLPPFPGFRTTPFLDYLEDQRDPRTGDKLTWKCYFSDLPFLGFWYQFAAFHIGNFSVIENFVSDCKENKLPTISVIDPPFSLADDHPAHDVRLGQKFLGLIVDALTHSESWETTALVLLYDENGSFYDHVVPPASFEVEKGLPALDTPLGFRVPAVVVSPYAKRKFGCRTCFDHTSIMKSISVRWGVEFPEEKFGTRWKHAPDIWEDCFDFHQAPLPIGLYTQTEEAITVNRDPEFRNLLWESTTTDLLTNPVGGIEALLERIFILPNLKLLDKRASVFESLNSMEKQIVNLKRIVPSRSV